MKNKRNEKREADYNFLYDLFEGFMAKVLSALGTNVLIQ